jgi:hypothetical protein
MFRYSAAMEAAMPDDAKDNAEPIDDLHVLAGVVALVSIALMTTAVLA